MPDSAYNVSVIVRSGEVNQWLDESVRSVLASTDVSLQVILVLNGPKVSVEASAVRAEEERYPWLTDSRVKVLRYDHYLGISGSIIAGTSAVDSGVEFIANVDGDDIVHPDKFSLQISYMRENPDCVLVGTKAEIIDSEGKITGVLKSAVGSDIRKYLFLYNPLPHSSVLFRQAAYRKIGGHTPHLDQYEDYDLILRIALLGKIAILPQKLVKYRVHATNSSKGATPTGPHVDCVTRGRRNLAKKLKVPFAVAWPQHLLWRSVQYVRAFGFIKPLHEY